jgi:hypoxia up-regulated 1
MAPPGRRRGQVSPLTLILGLVFLFSSTASAASAVLGIDLGTEYIKAALVKPGIPLEIVLTKDSKRKEISAVAFKPSKSGALPAGSFPERFYGSDAVALAARFPGEVYPNLKALLGIQRDSEGVTVYRERYPALEVSELEGRNTAAFKSKALAEDEKPFTVEELLAMELKNVRENAKVMAGKGVDIQDIVITVPPFYTVDERRALEVATRLAGLKLLGVVSDGLAIGINYATSRTFPVVNDGGKPEVNLVFDMGAGSTTATVLKFQGKTVKDVGRFNKTIQEVQVLGTGWDRTLGGDALNSLIVNDMVASFADTPSAKSASLTAEKVKSHGRAAAKMWKDAEKIRQVLSANQETTAFFESFIDDVDFRYKLSRTKFEDMAAAFVERVDGPVQQALTIAGLKMADIDSVILHGGAIRTPFVQKKLESLAGASKLKSNVNSDEAAVFGAAFKAAGLSPSFRVKEIRDLDIQSYAFGIQYMFNTKDLDQKIFVPTSKVGSIKDLPFQMMGEFDFSMYQAVPSGGKDVVKTPVLHFRTGNLTRQVTKMIDTDGCDRETFDNFVQVRLSPITGLPEVTAAWVTCETEEAEAKGSVMDNVKGFFGMGGKRDQEPLKEGESASEASESTTSSSSSSSSTSSASSSASSASAEPEASDAAKTKPKKKTVKSAITYHVTLKGYDKIPRKEFKRMMDRLAAFDASDKSRRLREEALNNLEAFTYRARDYLEDEAFIAASTSEVRSTLEQKLSATSDWIYEEGPDATEEVLATRLKDLKAIVDPIQKRKDEAAKRPEAVKGLQDALQQLSQVTDMVKEQIKVAADASSKAAEESSKSASEAASSTTSATESATPSSDDDLEDEELLKSSASSASSSSSAVPEPSAPPMYSEEDLKSLSDAADASKKWLEEKLVEQKKLKESDDPAFTVKDINDQTKKLNDVLMEMMMKKMRVPPKPKAKPKAKKAKKPKKSSKKDKAASSDEKKPEEKTRQEQEDEIKEALEKAGVDSDKVKIDFGHPKEIKDENGKPLVKLDLPEDASEEDIMAAIDKATKEGKEKMEEEKKRKAEAKRVKDEL